MKQYADVLLEVSEHYDKNEGDRGKLKKQMLYLLAGIDKVMKENVK